MPTPTAGSDYSLVTLSSVALVDALLIGTKWGTSGEGNGASITYSFPGASSSWSTNWSYGYGSSYSGGEPWSASYRGLNTAQQAAFRSAMQAWANVANIQVTETADNASVVGDIRAAFTLMSGNYAAWAYYPQYGPRAGDIWLNTADSSNNVPSVGSYGYMTLLHELGHALGLKHPFEAASSNGAIMPSERDSLRYTVMSYTEASFADAQPSTPMVYDILAIQYLYGANLNHNTGNDTYSFSATSETMLTIWDAGGTDTIDASNQTQNATIDLRPGQYSSIGIRSSGGRAVDNIGIAFHAIIENAIGGSGHDLIFGNSVANILIGGDGDDTIHTEGGNDTVYGGNGGDAVYLGDPGGTVLLSGVETVAGGAGFDLVMLENISVLHASGAVDALIGSSATEIVTLQNGGMTLIAASLETLIGGSGTDRANLGNRGNTTVLSGIEIAIGSLNTDVITLADVDTTIIASRLETLIGGSGTVDRVNLGNLGSTTVLSGMEIAIGSLNTDVITLADVGTTIIASRLETLIGGSGTDRVNLGNLGSTTVMFGIEEIIGSLNTDLITLGSPVPELRIQGVETLSGSAGDDAISVIMGGGMTFNGGLGADTLILSNAAAMDVVAFFSPDDGGAAGSTSGYDRIFNFQSGTDVVVIGGSLRSALDRNGDGSLAVAERGANGISVATDELVVLNGTVSSLADTDLGGIRSAVGTVTGSPAASFLLIGRDDTSSGLYLVSGGGGTVAAADIRLLATFSGTFLTASDIRLV